MYRATLICDADAGVLAVREDAHPANELAHRAWQEWRASGSSSAAFETIDMDAVDDYISTQSVDPYFLDFLDFAYEQKVFLALVTQRMGRVVETILRREGIEQVPIFANRMDVEPFTIRLRFPYYNVLGCDSCPSCNLYHLRNFRRPGLPLVFVGDKEADVCTAAEADLVFARNGLARRCREAGIDHEPFEQLRDVERVLMRMMVKGQFKLKEQPRRELLSPPLFSPNGGRSGTGSRS